MKLMHQHAAGLMPGQPSANGPSLAAAAQDSKLPVENTVDPATFNLTPADGTAFAAPNVVAAAATRALAAETAVRRAAPQISAGVSRPTDAHHSCCPHVTW